MVSQPKIVSVNDKMQRDYRYAITSPIGRDFDPEFRPELTPKQMLALGVFCGRRAEFPASWFAHARLARLGRDLPELLRRRCQPAPVSVARERRDSSRRPARLVPVVLPLLYGPPPGG
jgi:hypothetical protein